MNMSSLSGSGPASLSFILGLKKTNKEILIIEEVLSMIIFLKTIRGNNIE